MPKEEGPSRSEGRNVNPARNIALLRDSLNKGIEWVVFEPNGAALWARVRQTLENFLLNEWKAGALAGKKPEEAYWVRCDRSTMTQNDLDNGRLVCDIGVAPTEPAEFVVIQIGQWTADRKPPA